jgi:hypothetical protein
MPTSTRRKTANRAPGRRRRAATRGRPAVHGEAWTKVTIVLFDRQIVALHRLSADIRAKTGHFMNRTQIIRALIDSLVRSKVDVTDSASEAELTKRLLHHFLP